MSEYFLTHLRNYQSDLSSSREGEWIGFVFGTHGEEVEWASMARARLILASLGMTTDGFNCALAVEFVHNASLIVDDMIDRAKQRRGRNVFWKQFGNQEALLASHIFIQNAFSAIRATSFDRATLDILQFKLHSTVKSMALNEVETLRTRIDGLDSYIDRASSRSGALYRYVGLVMSMAPELKDQSPQLIDVLSRIGIVHQIWDDLGDANPRQDYSDVFIDKDAEFKNVQNGVFKLTEFGFSEDDLRSLHARLSNEAIRDFKALIKSHANYDTLRTIAADICGQPKVVEAMQKAAM